jgi:hypothetical protein
VNSANPSTADGDTTDEDVAPPATLRPQNSQIRRQSPSATSSVANTPKPFPRSKRSRKGPVLGSFVVDQQKAMAFIDPNTKQLRIQRARSPFLNPFLQNSTESSAGNSPQVPFQALSYDSDQSSQSHLFTGPSDVMMSGVFGGVPGQRYQNGRYVVEAPGQLLIGPPEAFYAFTSFRADGTPDTDGFEDLATEDEEFDNDGDLLDYFLDMDADDDEDEEEDMDGDESSTPLTTDAAETAASSHTSKISQDMLNHFDRGVVNSFRNNQDRYRTISRLAHDTSNLAAPVRTGKSAEALMTPPRKRKSNTTSEKRAPRRLPMMGGFR